MLLTTCRDGIPRLWIANGFDKSSHGCKEGRFDICCSLPATLNAHVTFCWLQLPPQQVALPPNDCYPKPASKGLDSNNSISSVRAAQLETWLPTHRTRHATSCFFTRTYHNFLVSMQRNLVTFWTVGDVAQEGQNAYPSISLWRRAILLEGECSLAASSSSTSLDDILSAEDDIHVTRLIALFDTAHDKSEKPNRVTLYWQALDGRLECWHLRFTLSQKSYCSRVACAYGMEAPISFVAAHSAYPLAVSIDINQSAILWFIYNTSVRFATFHAFPSVSTLSSRSGVCLSVSVCVSVCLIAGPCF